MDGTVSLYILPYSNIFYLIAKKARCKLIIEKNRDSICPLWCNLNNLFFWINGYNSNYMDLTLIRKRSHKSSMKDWRLKGRKNKKKFLHFVSIKISLFKCVFTFALEIHCIMLELLFINFFFILYSEAVFLMKSNR